MGFEKVKKAAQRQWRLKTTLFFWSELDKMEQWGSIRFL
jgi:hypothetical protein